jgi:hypothetical protein
MTMLLHEDSNLGSNWSRADPGNITSFQTQHHHPPPPRCDTPTKTTRMHLRLLGIGLASFLSGGCAHTTPTHPQHRPRRADVPPATYPPPSVAGHCVGYVLQASVLISLLESRREQLLGLGHRRSRARRRFALVGGLGLGVPWGWGCPRCVIRLTPALTLTRSRQLMPFIIMFTYLFFLPCPRLSSLAVPLPRHRCMCHLHPLTMRMRAGGR